ncbi:MAG: tRNA (adenosine(37)-N6)-threonylcarbamoyltransferase complex ATPase subunit type 1 TsaE [Actinomycetaceae bacterium]|nr:tRNA (adenosine(37)-N6)-threonylcarbamoyltransferase complex ATPase subunit type 1 TsaE [Actinomycetaceae bacterium]
MNTASVFCVSPSPECTRNLGQAVAALCRAGDVIMLSGDLGAGKTTFTQGLGQGLNVCGGVSSPTFIVSRVHPPRIQGGTALIHTDAYRIGDLDDVETLDLDSQLDQAVTVIEWGEGKTESLSADRLEVFISKEEDDAPLIFDDGTVDLENADNGRRYYEFRPASKRWSIDDLRSAIIAANGVELCDGYSTTDPKV